MKPIVYTLLILCFFYQAEAQVVSGPTKNFSYGAFIGLEHHSMGASLNTKWQAGDPSVAFEPKSPGFSIGAFSRWAIWPGFAFQPELGISYTQNQARLQNKQETVQKTNYRFANLEMPIHFVISNPGSTLPIRGIILFGGRFGMNLIDNYHPEGISLLREHWALDLGLGAEFLLKNIKIQPEMVYSHGMNNLHDFENSVYDWTMGRIVRDRVALRVLILKK